MAKRPETNSINSGYASTELLNDNFQKIEEAFDNTLSRDGSIPNQMNVDLDMNGNSILNVKASSGDDNFSWRDDWASSTTYSQNNLVFVTIPTDATNGGSSYICLVDHTSTGSFADDLANNYWTLFAQQGDEGAPGAGTGDVVGPAGAVADQVATFDGSTGKIIKDSGVILGDAASKNVGNTSSDVAAGSGSTVYAPLASPALTGNPTAPTQSAGDNSTKVATTAYVDAAVPTVATSSDLTIISADAGTFAHGLGDTPTSVEVFLVCQTADAGYTPGNIIKWWGSHSADKGVAIRVNATNVVYRYGNDAGTFSYINATTGGTATLINTSWKMRIVARL